MVYDKNYFLDQLRNGAKIEDIGQALADAMNEAQEAHIAEQVAAAKAAKREMAMDMIDIIRDYGLMVAPETADVMNEIDDEDIDMMVTTLDEMFHMLAALANLKHTVAKAPVGNSKPSDDAILANFIASLT